MEESTCHKMVIGLLKRFSCMKCLFSHLFISFKHDFHVDDESMIVRTREMSIVSANILTLRHENSSTGKICRYL